MQSNIGKWGNSLAIRLPAECIRASGLKDGEPVEVSVTTAGEIRIASAAQFDKRAFLKRLDGLHSKMPESDPTLPGLRDSERY